MANIVTLEVDLPPKLVPVFSGKARYRGAYGGRGSGKSMSFAKMAIVRMMTDPHPFLCCRELQNTIRDSVHSLLADQIAAMGVGDLFEIGSEFIRHRETKAPYLFKGLRSNAEEIKGLHGVKYVWLYEAQKASQKSLDYLLPTIRLPDSEIWAEWNPQDEDDPIHNLLVTNCPHNARVTKINWRDNEWFPAVLEEERLRTLKYNPQRYDWIWEGNFNINVEGAVYAKWLNQRENAGAFRKDLYDPELPVQTAWDIGFSDYTTIWFFQTTGGEIRIIDYYEHNREGVPHYVSQLLGIEITIEGATPEGKLLYKRGKEIEDLQHRRAYKYGKHWVPHDAAHKLFAANGRSVIQQADDLGVRMYVMPAIPQQAQIEVTRATIPQSWFDPVRCADGLRALRKYQFEFDEDKNRYKDDPLHDWSSHGADAFELLCQVQRQPVIEKPKPPPTYWHDQQSKDIFFPTDSHKRERI